MKIFAICSLVVFIVVKAIIYIVEFLSKRGYVTDFGHVLSIVLPVMSALTYIGCFFTIGNMRWGFFSLFTLAWLIFIVSIIVVKNLRYAFCYITATTNRDGYNVAKGVIDYVRKIDRDIIFDDNIGMYDSIKIIFDRKKFTRSEMAFLIDEMYNKVGAKKQIRKLSLVALMVHSAELILDISFLINVSIS